MFLKDYRLYYEQDEWISNHIEGNTRWVVKLSNGLHIYQDDHRTYPEFNDERRYSTWTRLRHYCYDMGPNVEEMWLQFRSNRCDLPANKGGYYFCKSVLGSPFMKTQHFFKTGVVENGIIVMWEWRIPELAQQEIEPREIVKNDICLILREDLRNA